MITISQYYIVKYGLSLTWDLIGIVIVFGKLGIRRRLNETSHSHCPPVFHKGCCPDGIWVDKVEKSLIRVESYLRVCHNREFQLLFL